MRSGFVCRVMLPKECVAQGIELLIGAGAADMRNLFASIGLGFASNPLTSEEEAMAQAAYDDEDYKTALPLLRRGAKESDPDALHRLGVMYDEGWGVKLDPKRAHELYEKAGEQDHTAVLFCLGYNYMEGSGVTKDLQQARRFYERTVEVGGTQSLVNLGRMYEDGLGGDRDIQKAADMYKRAADEGRSNGHFCYACSVLAGHLPGVDRAVGFHHLLEACKQGNQLSLTHLMRLYLERDRDTFEVSQEEVLKLAMFGAKTGHTLSLLVHVAAYWRGDNYEQDRIMAYRDLATHLAIHLEDPDFNAEAIVVHLEELRAEFSEAELDAAREAVAEHATFEVLLILAHIYYRRMGRAQMPSLQPDEEESDRWIEVSEQYYGIHSQRYVGMFEGRKLISNAN